MNNNNTFINYSDNYNVDTINIISQVVSSSSNEENSYARLIPDRKSTRNSIVKLQASKQKLNASNTRYNMIFSNIIAFTFVLIIYFLLISINYNKITNKNYNSKELNTYNNCSKLINNFRVLERIYMSIGLSYFISVLFDIIGYNYKKNKFYLDIISTVFSFASTITKVLIEIIYCFILTYNLFYNLNCEIITTVAFILICIFVLSTLACISIYYSIFISYFVNKKNYI